MSPAPPVIPVSVAVGGIVFLAIGALLLVRPRAFLDRYYNLLDRMRGLPLRTLTEWEMGHLKTRTAAIVTRSFGAMVMLAGAWMVFLYAMAGAA